MSGGFPSMNRGVNFCTATISSTATMGTGGNFDTDYTGTGLSKSASGQETCNAWDWSGGAANATKGPTNSDYSISSTTAFTMTAWVYPTSVGTTHGIIGFYGNLTGTHWAAIRILSDDKVQAWSSNNGVTTVETIKTTNTISVNTWHHLAFIHDGTTHTVYLDADTGSKGTGTGDGGAASSGNWVIAGGWGHNVTIPTAPFLKGRIDQAVIWDSALTEANITTLYNSGTPILPDVVDANNIKGYWNFSETSGAAENKAV